MSKKIKIDINNKSCSYWDNISEKYVLDEKLIRDNINKISWSVISEYQKLSEDFIKEFSNKVDWAYISSCQNLSEDFIRKFYYKVEWCYISKYQKLSEDFIREFYNNIDWWNAGIYQKLNQEFIRENCHKLTPVCIARYQKLNPEFIKEYNLTIPETCWLYKDKEFKREHIKKYTKYKIIGDKVIAYKSCRSDGYSLYNFQYYYKVGGEYKVHANYNINEENSFGLSAWTKEQALQHHSTGKLFKVEIDLEDVAAIVCDRNKIRASKIKILEEIKI